MRIIVMLLALCMGVLLAQSASAQSKDMKSTAPEKMLPPGEAEKMRACNAKAMVMKISMADKAAFVKKCMAEMK